MDKYVNMCSDAYEAAAGADAVVIVTEWDEFKELNYNKVFAAMKKPAFIFDGRLILNHSKLQEIGFQVQAIGKSM